MIFEKCGDGCIVEYVADCRIVVFKTGDRWGMCILGCKREWWGDVGVV